MDAKLGLESVAAREPGLEVLCPGCVEDCDHRGADDRLGALEALDEARRDFLRHRFEDRRWRGDTQRILGWLENGRLNPVTDPCFERLRSTVERADQTIVDAGTERAERL